MILYYFSVIVIETHSINTTKRGTPEYVDLSKNISCNDTETLIGFGTWEKMYLDLKSSDLILLWRIEIKFVSNFTIVCMQKIINSWLVEKLQTQN